MQKLTKQCLLGLSILLALAFSPLVLAISILDVAPNTNSVSLSISSLGTTSITYTVTNNTQHAINQMVISPAFQTAGNAASISLQNDNCTPITLAAGTTCTFQVALQGQGQPLTGFTLQPRICGLNGSFCSVANAGEIVQVTITA